MVRKLSYLGEQTECKTNSVLPNNLCEQTTQEVRGPTGVVTNVSLSLENLRKASTDIWNGTQRFMLNFTLSVWNEFYAFIHYLNPNICDRIRTIRTVSPMSFLRNHVHHPQTLVTSAVTHHFLVPLTRREHKAH